MEKKISVEHQKSLEAFLSALTERKIKAVVFDMDRTIIAQHSRGAILESKLLQFLSTISPVVEVLIPYLLDKGIKVAIATLSDDFYSKLLTERDKRMGKTRDSVYLSGAELVKKILAKFLTIAQLKEVIMVTLNPDLYSAESDDDEGKQFFFDKLTSHGLGTDAKKKIRKKYSKR